MPYDQEYPYANGNTGSHYTENPYATYSYTMSPYDTNTNPYTFDAYAYATDPYTSDPYDTAPYSTSKPYDASESYSTGPYATDHYATNPYATDPYTKEPYATAEYAADPHANDFGSHHHVRLPTRYTHGRAHLDDRYARSRAATSQPYSADEYQDSFRATSNSLMTKMTHLRDAGLLSNTDLNQLIQSNHRHATPQSSASRVRSDQRNCSSGMAEHAIFADEMAQFAQGNAGEHAGKHEGKHGNRLRSLPTKAHSAEVPPLRADFD